MDIHEYTEIAISIFNGDGYVSGGFFHQNIFPSAFLQPVYTYLLALFIKISLLPFAFLNIRLLQIFFNLCLCLMIYIIGQKVFNKSAALWACFIFSVYIPFAYMTTFVWDTLLFSLQLAIIVWLVLEFDNRRIFQSIWLGFLLGLATLTNSVILAFIPFLIGYLFSKFRETPQQTIKNLLIVFFCFVILVTPWSIRNSLVFRSFVPVRTGFWLNLYLGNNEAATGTVFLKNGSQVPLKYKDGLVRHFGPMMPILAKMNEAEQDQYFKEKFFIFVSSRPFDFSRLLLIKLFYYLWFNPFEKPMLFGELQYLIVSLLALGGFYAAIKRKKKIGLLVLVMIPFIVSYTLIGPFFNWKYRLPIEPYLIILAGYCISQFKELKEIKQIA